MPTMTEEQEKLLFNAKGEGLLTGVDEDASFQTLQLELFSRFLEETQTIKCPLLLLD